MIVYICIGNSDDKLTQREWSDFVGLLDGWLDWSLDGAPGQLHGRWFAAPDAPWQNACWCVEMDQETADQLKAKLSTVVTDYRQDSITWAVAETEFLRGTDG